MPAHNQHSINVSSYYLYWQNFSAGSHPFSLLWTIVSVTQLESLPTPLPTHPPAQLVKLTKLESVCFTRLPSMASR